MLIHGAEMETNIKSIREEIIKKAKKRYGVSPEYLWAKFPKDAVLRHADNKKWFAVFMDVERSKLGGLGNEDGDKIVEILDVKAEPEMVGLLTAASGYFPGYHMNKKSWVTVLLDGTVDKEQVLSLLDNSFALTESKPKGKAPGKSGSL